LKIEKKIEWWEIGLLAVITAIGAWIRFHDLGAKSVWLDEAFTLWMARLSVPELFEWITKIDQHPPLFYLAMHYWRQLGEGEATARALSAILSTATIPVMYFVARRFLGVASAIITVILLAMSRFHLRFAQEMRMYALLCFNVSWALLALAYLLTGDHRKRWWAVYAIFTVLTMLTQNTAVLFPLAANVAFLAVLLIVRYQSEPDLQPPTFKAWVLGQLGVFLLWLPWAPSFITQVVMVDNEFWIQPPTGATIFSTILTFFSDWRPWELDWLLLVVVLLIVLAVVALLRKPGLLAFLLLLIIVPFATELVVSLRRPIFYDRTLIWTTLPLFIFLSSVVGVWVQRAGAVRWIALPGAMALLALLYANGLSMQNYFDNFHKEEWREAAAWVAEQVGEDDLLLFNATWIQLPFEYYFDRFDKNVAKHGAPVDLFDAGVLEPKMTTADQAALMERAWEYNCIWLVYSHDWYTDPSGLVPGTLRISHIMAEEQQFVGLKVLLFWKRGGTPCPASAEG
jgi:uncharacterized membrane protein